MPDAPKSLKISPTVRRVLTLGAAWGGAGLAVQFAARGMPGSLAPAAIAGLGAAVVGLLAAATLSARRLLALEEGQAVEPCKHEKQVRIVALIAACFVLALTRAIPIFWWAGISLLGGYFVVRLMAYDPPPAGAGAGAQRKPTLTDSLSGLLAAMVIIVLSYAYLLEAFRIPTGSMEPTLFGDPLWGDRALVNKVAYRVGEPERGDIAVFRFPQMRSQPYVKRIAGLPGETVLIAQGDLYVLADDGVTFGIVRREGAERESVWLRQMEFEGDEPNLRRWFAVEAGSVKASAGAITLSGKEGGAVLRYPREGSISNHCPIAGVINDLRYDGELVGDARIAADVEVESGASFAVTLQRGAEAVEFAWKGGKPSLVVRGSNGEQVLELFGDLPDEVTSFSFGLADDGVDLVLNGERFERVTFEGESLRALRKLLDAGRFEPTTPSGMSAVMAALPSRKDCCFEIGAKGGQVVLSKLTVDRDLHYLGRTVAIAVEGSDGRPVKPINAPTVPYAVKLGADGFFMLGDHSENSEDSRKWITVEVALKDGTVRKTQISEFFGGRGNPDAQRRMSAWFGRINNTLFAVAADASKGVPVADTPEELSRQLTVAAAAGEFGQIIRFADIYGIAREVKFSDVAGVTMRHTPEVPRKLIDGQLLGSLFPVPRLVD